MQKKNIELNLNSNPYIDKSKSPLKPHCKAALEDRQTGALGGCIRVPAPSLLLRKPHTWPMDGTEGHDYILKVEDADDTVIAHYQLAENNLQSFHICVIFTFDLA